MNHKRHKVKELFSIVQHVLKSVIYCYDICQQRCIRIYFYFGNVFSKVHNNSDSVNHIYIYILYAFLIKSCNFKMSVERVFLSVKHSVWGSSVYLQFIILERKYSINIQTTTSSLFIHTYLITSCVHYTIQVSQMQHFQFHLFCFSFCQLEAKKVLLIVTNHN